MATRIPVAIEETPKKSFATAIDWPGWSRSGKNVAGALEALAAYADRYRVVLTLAGVDFPAGELELEVFETAGGGAGTEFGVPSRVTDADRRPTTAAEGERLACLVRPHGPAWRRSPSTRPRPFAKAPAAAARTGRRCSATSSRPTSPTPARSG